MTGGSAASTRRPGPPQAWFPGLMLFSTWVQESYVYWTFVGFDGSAAICGSIAIAAAW